MRSDMIINIIALLHVFYEGLLMRTNMIIKIIKL
jgi:hypothetical protein